MLTIGRKLQYRYTIIHMIGQGGVGAVYEGRDERLKNRVAIKHLQLTDPATIKDFEREAQLLANLKHPSLPKVIDHFIEGSNHFLVMEYIPGDDLATQLTTRGMPFPPQQVIGWADALLAVLAYLHCQQPPIVHHDIKPGNLKICGDGILMLLDFGLAKEAITTTLRTNNSVRGYTPHYAPLEQIQGTGTGIQSDLYAVGATIYHLLVGNAPPDALTRAASVVNGTPDPLIPAHIVNQAIPKPVGLLIQQALSIGYAQRPKSADAMRTMLQSGSLIQGRGYIPIAALPTNASTSMIHSVGVPTRHRQGSRKRIVALVMCLLVAGGVWGWNGWVKEQGQLRYNEAPLPESPSSSESNFSPTVVGIQSTMEAISISLPTPSLIPENNEISVTRTVNTSLPSMPPAPSPLPDAVITIAHLNLRFGPSTAYDSLGIYPQGTPLIILGKDEGGGWLKVETPDERSGWMFAANLNINRKFDTINIAEAPPMPTLQPTVPIVPTISNKPISLNGTWAGITSLGGPIDIIVEDNMVVVIDAHPYGYNNTTCRGRFELRDGYGVDASIINDQFSAQYGEGIIIAGTISAEKMSGTVTSWWPHLCNSPIQFTWVVHK